jgi:hypothetical protein
LLNIQHERGMNIALFNSVQFKSNSAYFWKFRIINARGYDNLISKSIACFISNIRNNLSYWLLAVNYIHWFKNILILIISWIASGKKHTNDEKSPELHVKLPLCSMKKLVYWFHMLTINCNSAVSFDKIVSFLVKCYTIFKKFDN